MFNIKILKETLGAVLDYLKPVVGKNAGGIPYDHIVMRSTSTGSCVFYASNSIEHAMVEAVCSTSGGPDIAPLVDFARLKAVTSTIPDGKYIELSGNNNNELEIKFNIGRKPMKLTGIVPTKSNSSMPKEFTLPAPLNGPDPMTCYIPSERLSYMIKRAAGIMTETESQAGTTPLGKCVRFSVDGRQLSVEAMDARSQRTFYMSSDIAQAHPAAVSYVIEAKRLSNAVKMFEDYVDIVISNDNASNIFIYADTASTKTNQSAQYSQDIVDTRYGIRKLAGVFSNISQYYGPRYAPAEYVKIASADLLETIARCEALGRTAVGNQPVLPVEMSAANDNVTLKYSTSHGSLDETLDSESMITQPVNGIFKCDMLKNIVKMLGTDFITIGKMQNTTGSFLIKGMNAGSAPMNEGYTMLSFAPQMQTP